MKEIAALLDAFGCWGVVAMFTVGIVYLYQRGERSHKRELAMAERILPLVEELKGFLYARRSG